VRALAIATRARPFRQSRRRAPDVQPELERRLGRAERRECGVEVRPDLRGGARGVEPRSRGAGPHVCHELRVVGRARQCLGRRRGAERRLELVVRREEMRPVDLDRGLEARVPELAGETARPLQVRRGGGPVAREEQRRAERRLEPGPPLRSFGPGPAPRGALEDANRVRVVARAPEGSRPFERLVERLRRRGGCDRGPEEEHREQRGATHRWPKTHCIPGQIRESNAFRSERIRSGGMGGVTPSHGGYRQPPATAR
jgi:hypothetical protein